MKQLKSKRGVRLNKDEIDELQLMIRAGRTNKHIAQRLGRHEQTVASYRKRIEAESEVAEIRRSALASAQRDHWRQLNSTLQTLRGRFTSPDADRPKTIQKWRPPQLSPSEQHLVRVLREHHAPNFTLWDHWDRWQVAGRSLRDAVQNIVERVDQITAQQNLSANAMIESQYHRELLRAWLRSCIGANELELWISDPQEKDPRALSPHVLIHDQQRIATGIKSGVGTTRELFIQAVSQLKADPESNVVNTSYILMHRFQAEIDDNLEKMSLLEGFAGECELCPLNTVQQPKRRRRPRRL